MGNGEGLDNGRRASKSLFPPSRLPFSLFPFDFISDRGRARTWVLPPGILEILTPAGYRAPCAQPLAIVIGPYPRPFDRANSFNGLMKLATSNAFVARLAHHRLHHLAGRRFSGNEINQWQSYFASEKINTSALSQDVIG